MSNRMIFSGMLLFTAACVTQAIDAQSTLVCSGTRLNGTAFTFPFVANTSPAPTLGVACVPSGKVMPKGKAVMGTAPKAATVFAVVFVRATKAGGTSTSGAGPAGATLVCSGTRLNGAAFTFSFVANTSPTPTLGVACVPSGKKMPKGTAVMGTAPKAGTVLAVVLVPPSTAGGATSGAGFAGEALVCQGTRLNGTPFTFPFMANTSPAPTPGVACVPSGKVMPKGTAAMGTAPKAGTVFAVVFVPPSTAGGTPTASQPPSSSPPAAAPAVTIPPAYESAIQDLGNARSNFVHAGSSWGPHLANANNYINDALDSCGLPQPAGSGAILSGVPNSPTVMAGATELLTQAQTEFQNATNPWGGRRDTALSFIVMALEEIKLANAAATPPTTTTK